MTTFYYFFKFVDGQLKGRSRLIDLGSGYGFIARLFKDLLRFQEAYGVDIDPTALNKARKHVVALKGVLNDTLPFPNKFFDLAISFGVLDHMVYWDNFFIEAHRILRHDGILAISLTNLGSWDTRISILLVFQPRHVEVSRKYLVGFTNIILLFQYLLVIFILVH